MSEVILEKICKVIPVDEATGLIPVDGVSPITVIGTPAIREAFDDLCIKQAINSRSAPGVTHLVLNPDAHAGYGAPVGCVMASPSHIYPGPVGVDIKCSMSLLQTNLPADAVKDRRVRRALIDAIAERIPTGAGRGIRHARKARDISRDVGTEAVTAGASELVCDALGIPLHWALHCEDSHHVGHDETADSLRARLDWHVENNTLGNVYEKFRQLGSYGGGNHFGECEIVELADPNDPIAASFGLKDGHVAFLSHCGSRGLGHNLAAHQFRVLQKKFNDWAIPLPGNDRELVYAPIGSPEGNAYIDDMSIGANFATVNHLLINALVLEAFAEVIPGTVGELVYFISHNIVRREIVDGRPSWVHRKGATRAFPAGHFGLRDTPFESTGHPILLPGNPRDGSAVMVALPGAEKSLYSVNHGAGRQMGRRHAIRTLDQKQVDRELDELDILSNCRQYPRDEAPDAYKDFNEVIRSVELAGLARTVARLKARFVLKDASGADD